MITDTSYTVSAIVTCMTDGERPYLVDCLRSLLQQNEPLDEIVLAIEERNQWIATIAESGHPLIRLIRLPLMPVGAARNAALPHTRNAWVAFCDGDDAWTPDKNSAAVATLRSTTADVVGSDHILCDEQLIPCCYALARNLPMPSGWIIRRHLLEQYPFDPTLRCGEDGAWWIRSAPQTLRLRCRAGFVLYRVRGGSSSSDTPSKRRKHRIVRWTNWWLCRRPSLAITRLYRLIAWSPRYTWIPWWGPTPPPRAGT